MTNYEHYKSEIEKIVRLGWRVAVDKDGKPHACNEMNCNNCIVDNSNCYQTVAAWADTKYIEPEVDWSKVEVDTPILVRDSTDSGWLKRYFAKYEYGIIYAFYDGGTSWSRCEILSWKYAKLAENNNE